MPAPRVFPALALAAAVLAPAPGARAQAPAPAQPPPKPFTLEVEVDVVSVTAVVFDNGLIYERVPGESMLDLINRKPWNVLRYARRLARLHAQMHAHKFETNVPDQHWRIENKINHTEALSASVRKGLLEALASLPAGDRVCHGDFHPANVLIADDEETVIDWIDASRGNPLADVARTSILALGVAENNQGFNPFLKNLTTLLHSAYLRHYFHLRPGGEEEYRRWLPIAAGARLSENIPELEQWLVRKATTSIK